ncbi:MAG: cold shock domain-containing protein [Bryobacterales bacterium]
MESLEFARLGLQPAEEALAERCVQRWIRRLQRGRHPLIMVRVAVERAQGSPRDGNPYRVRVRATAPGHKEIVAVRGPGDVAATAPLSAVINDTFQALDRQLRDTMDRARTLRRWRQPERGDGAEGGIGFVLRIARHDGYGFLRGLDGEEVYFHRNAVLPSFEDVEVGTQVHFETELGDEGLQATTVRVLDKPPHRPGTGAVADPEGWLRREPTEA